MTAAAQEPIGADGKFECQVCGKRVRPDEFHDLAACQEYLFNERPPDA